MLLPFLLFVLCFCIVNNAIWRVCWACMRVQARLCVYVHARECVLTPSMRSRRRLCLRFSPPLPSSLQRFDSDPCPSTLNDVCERIHGVRMVRTQRVCRCVRLFRSVYVRCVSGRCISSRNAETDRNNNTKGHTAENAYRTDACFFPSRTRTRD